MEQVEVENEAGRLSAVNRYDVLDSPPDGAFDRITALMQLDVTARAEHWSVVLVGARGHVKRVLELCHVHKRISMVDSGVVGPGEVVEAPVGRGDPNRIGPAPESSRVD